MAEFKTLATREGEHLTNHFAKKGKFKNEVTLKFDDGQEYYVSEDFLKMASPVFSKILESDFKEKQTNVIELKDKQSADFLELLNYLHPAVIHRITEDTVFKIVPLAEEYCIVTAVADCRSTLEAMVNRLDERGKPAKYASRGCVVHSYHCDTLSKCLDILQIALSFSYKDIEKLVTSVISSFPSEMYLAYSKQCLPYVNKRCVEKYLELQEKIRLKLLQKRLINCDDSCEFEHGPRV